MEARAQAVTVFAVGVGNEITTSELVSIANKPSSTYVLYAQDYTTIHRIRDSMEQKLCEGRHQPFVPTQSPTWKSICSHDFSRFVVCIAGGLRYLMYPRMAWVIMLLLFSRPNFIEENGTYWQQSNLRTYI